MVHCFTAGDAACFLPSLEPPGETLAPEDIEMDSMTFSMEDVSSEEPKIHG